MRVGDEGVGERERGETEVILEEEEERTVGF